MTRKSHRWILTALTCAACFIVLSSCGKVDSSYASDAQAVSQTNSVAARLKNGGKPTDTDAKAVRTVYEKYPNAPEVRDLYKRLLIAREDWKTLEEVITSIPAKELKEDEKLDLAKVYFKLGAFDKAVEVLGRMEGEPDEERAVLLGRALFSLGRYDEAAKPLDARWKEITANNNIDGQITRGLIYFHDGKNSEAIGVLKVVLEHDPDSIPANNAISRLYSAMGDEAKATEHLNRVQRSFDEMTRKERSGAILVDKVTRLQKAYAEKNYSEVVKLGREVEPLLDQKNRLAIYRYLYDSYKSLGMEKEAEDTLRKARELSSK